MPHKNVVIVGAGFGGISAARKLARADCHVTMIDARNHHLFQPLLYQVAMAGLSPADIAVPIRSVLDSPNTEVLMATVTGVDTKKRFVHATDVHGKIELPYDYLVLATGAQNAYFGHDDWAKHAIGLKTLEEATAIRRKVLLAFEAAESERDPERVRAWLTFVVVGGGATGCELAGALAELSRRVLEKDFRHIDPTKARVMIVEGGDRILGAFPDSLTNPAQYKLADLGVELRLGERVDSIDAEGVVIAGERVAARTVIWAAGVRASPVGKWLDVATDRGGRVVVDDHCRVKGMKNVFVVGDAASFDWKGSPLPGLAPPAMQQGRFVGKMIGRLLSERNAGPPFMYFDKGNLATIGRGYAIGEFKGVRFKGIIAWMVWALVHIYYLIGFENRLLVLMQWAWAYFTYHQGARLIVGARTNLEENEA